jgi:mono/diheme cytochrome c family protein
MRVLRGGAGVTIIGASKPNRFASMHHPPFPLIALSYLVAFAARLGAAEPPADFFRQKVEPLLAAHCLECHGPERKGGLDLRSRSTALAGGESGPVLVPGKPEKSLLWEYVSTGQMPPKHKLSAAEVEIVKRWISQGAYFPDRQLDWHALTTHRRAGYDWWSLQPIHKPRPPAVRAAERALTPIDRFLLARLEAAGLSFAPPADRATCIRRVTYDLTGLPPTYEQVREFASDPRPDAYERLVDRLLASPHYGERWGRVWLDVVRFAESNGFERDRIRRTLWPYRDYVIAAFNDDKPYDQFVREQLAGDAMWSGHSVTGSGSGSDPTTLIATGFLVAGPKNDVDTISELERLNTRQDELDDFVSTTCTTFLGMTIGCARCHDHKFDPITSKDYYSLTAVFSGLDRGENVVASAAEEARRGAEVARLNARLQQRRREIKALLAEAAGKAAVLRSSESLLPPVDVRRNVDGFAPVEAKFVRLTITATNTGSEPCLDELEIYGDDDKTNLAAARGAKATASSLLPGFPIHQVRHLNDGRYGNSQSWISNEPRGGWAQIELPAPATIRQVVWGRDREGKFQDRLATGYRIEVSLDGAKWTKVSDSSRRAPSGANELAETAAIAAFSASQRAAFEAANAEIARLDAELKALPPLPVCYSARDSQPRPALVLKRGNVRARGEPVGPATLTAVRTLSANLSADKNDSGPQRRLRLAEWIVDPRNPLTARVLVNRVWQHHFGTGIVDTPNDFGFSGGRPSHPELLDWLAADFVEHGWRIKRLHRQIVLSAAYRQSASHNAAAAAKDGANRLLWRMSPRRLDAEMLRDTMLSISGKLQGALGGPSFALFEYRDGNVPDYVLLERPGPETFRRAVYMYNIRTFQPPLLAAFDCPDPSVQTPRRASSTTALQALSLMNNHFSFEQAGYFADRVRGAAGEQPEAQATAAFRLALQRDPTAAELKTTSDFIRRHGLTSLCRVLFNMNEMLYVF